MALADTRYSQRRRTLAARLAGQRIDMMLVTNLIHVQYLSGFTGSNAALMLSKELNPQISTDGRYITQVAEEVPDIGALIARNCAAALLSQLEGPRRVGIEADEISVAQWEALQKVAGEDVTLVPVRGVVEELRLVKDPRELESLREVAELASQAYRDLLAAGELAVGRAERDIAADLEYRMRKAGAEHTSFDTIIASGPNSAKPHHGAGERVLQRGDLVTVDFGAFMGGFNSDMTRTVVMGEADEFSTEIYEVVKRAQTAGVEAATVGTALADVDRATREIIEEAGYGEYYIHSTGHGVGLEVHEGPYASSSGEGELREGMTLTIEPGIYVPGRGGVRIEDTLIITPGSPEVITRVSKDLTVL